MEQGLLDSIKSFMARCARIGNTEQAADTEDGFNVLDGFFA